MDTTDAGMETVAAYLTGMDAGGLALENEGEFRAFLEQNRQYWDYVDDALLERMKGVARVKFYVSDDPQGRRKLEQVTQGLEELRGRTSVPLGSLEVRTASLREEDWANNWKRYYKPLAIGERLYIVPEWEREAPVPPGRTAVYLDPGLAFGTGSHASTQLCLEGVEKYTPPEGWVLDLGCGSGILSIAALRLGAAAAIGVDIDPKAADVAYENAALNGIERERYTLRAGDVLCDRALVEDLSKRRYGLVLANIVADVIISLSAQVPRFLEEGGKFLCSGIIESRLEEVRAALEKNGLAVLEEKRKDGWCALTAGRER